MILSKLKLNTEVISAVFIIVLNTFLISATFFGGFILPLFILVMFFSFWISFIYPRSGIYAIVFLTLIFERFFTLAPIIIGYQEYKLYPLDVILGAIFLAYFIQFTLALVKGAKEKYLPENKYLIIFFILVGVHFLVDVVFFQTDKSLAFSSFKYYIFYPWIYFVILFFFKKEKDFLRLIKFYFAGAIGILFFIIFGIINGGGLWTEYTPLSTSGIRILAFTHGFYVLMGLLGVGIWSLYQKQKSLGLMKFLMFFWFIGLVGSMMRHLWIGLGFSLAMIYFFSKKETREIFRKNIFKGGMIFIFSIFLISFVATVSPHYTGFNKSVSGSINSIQERVGSLFADFNKDESFSWRELVWRESFKEYIKEPVWGMGFGKKIYVESIDYKDFVEVRNIHNSWLVLIFQGGLMVAVFFLVFVFKLLLRLIRLRNKGWQDILLIVLLLNYFVVAVFQPYWETNMLAIFFWIILGLIGVRNLSNFKHENSRNK